MRQEAWQRLQREWREDLPAIADGVDARPYPQGWALGDRLEDEPSWDAARESVGRTMQEVMRVVCHITGRSPHEMRGASRKRVLARRRHMVIALIDRLCPRRTLVEIAQFMDKAHTTVIHALKSFPAAVEADPDLAHEYDQCCRHFGLKL